MSPPVADGNSLREDALQALQEALAAAPPDDGLLRDLLAFVTPFDLADLLGRFRPEDKARLVRLLPAARAAVTLDETDETSRKQVLEQLGTDRLAQIVGHMPPDEGADLVEGLPDAVEDAVLARVAPAHREDIRHLSRYDPESAGGIMTTDFLSLSDASTAAEAIDAIRASAVVEVQHNVYLHDAYGVLTGVLADWELLRVAPGTPLGEVMHREPAAVQADLDQEHVAAVVSKYNISSVPVVDGARRLLGVVTVDDVIDVIEQEAEEDFQVMGGQAPLAEPLRAPLYQRLRARIPWLLVSMAGVFLSATLLTLAEQTFTEVFALVLFIPGIMALSGNVGLQTSTVIIRGLATGELRRQRLATLLVRESAQGLAIGVLFGALAALVVAAAFPEPEHLALVVGAALVVTITCATLLGTAVPLACHLLKIDPALAGGPFITTFNDSLALLLYIFVGSGLLALLDAG